MQLSGSVVTENLLTAAVAAPITAIAGETQESAAPSIVVSSGVEDHEINALKAISSGMMSDGQNESSTFVPGGRPRPYGPPGNQYPGQQRPPPGYICNRCGQAGHFIKFCPTNNDPTFDSTMPGIRLLNVPVASRKKLASIEGIDTTNTIVRFVFH